jgi:hypothetical protein
MNNKRYYSINKSLKSNKTSKKIPTYSFNKNSRLAIKLPNGLDLYISSNENGDYCSIRVHSHNNDNDYRMSTEKKESKFDNFSTQATEIDYFDNCGGLGISFTKFNEK